MATMRRGKIGCGVAKYIMCGVAKNENWILIWISECGVSKVDKKDFWKLKNKQQKQPQAEITESIKQRKRGKSIKVYREYTKRALLEKSMQI